MTTLRVFVLEWANEKAACTSELPLCRVFALTSLDPLLSKVDPLPFMVH